MEVMKVMEVMQETREAYARQPAPAPHNLHHLPITYITCITCITWYQAKKNPKLVAWGREADLLKGRSPLGDSQETMNSHVHHNAESSFSAIATTAGP
jgi:hypothetical protein